MRDRIDIFSQKRTGRISPLQKLHRPDHFFKTNVRGVLRMADPVTVKFVDFQKAFDRVVGLLACFINVLATWQCISGTDLLKQSYVLPHWDRSWRSNLLSDPVTVLWHRTNQSQRWSCNARRQPPGRVVTGVPISKSLVCLDLEKDPWRKRESNPGTLCGIPL